MTLPKNPRAAVTGAASGLGRAITLALAKRGASIAVSDIDLEGALETCKLARAAGAREATATLCDVTKLEQVEGFANAAYAALGGVDLVVNNAGVAVAGKTGEVPIEDWRWVVDINLWGVIYGCHVFVPRMKKQGGGGHVLNVASAAGLLNAPRMGPYNVTKAGVVALTETLAAELQGDNIGATALCPTFFRTNIANASRSTEKQMLGLVNKLMDSSKLQADDVAEYALRACDANETIAVPMADGRWMWRVKRLAPESYSWLGGKLAKRLQKTRD